MSDEMGTLIDCGCGRKKIPFGRRPLPGISSAQWCGENECPYYWQGPTTHLWPGETSEQFSKTLDAAA